MKKLDKFLNVFDRKVDKEVGPYMSFLKKNFVIFSSMFLTILVITFVVKVYYSKRNIVAQVVIDDLKLINNILHTVDKECNILNLKGERSIVDFLNVEKFAGSVIGGMNLAYPKKWAGPYLRQNPTLNGIYYEFVRAKDGFFIIPGSGAQLPNGLTIGKDINVNPSVEIHPMLKPGGKLFHKGVAYGLQIKFKVGDWDSPYRLPKSRQKKINKMLKEFNEAMPFTKNENQKSS